MGPYCKFCDERCFVPCPADAPGDVKEAFRDAAGGLALMATCPKGRAFDREKTGYSIDDVSGAGSSGR